MSEVKLPITCEVAGRIWHLFTFEYRTLEGVFAGYLHAISEEHASSMLEEMCSSAVLKGRMVEVL